MDITPVELERLAVLTRLALTEEEKASLSGQLGDVLGYVQRLAKVDTQGIPETDTVVQGFIGRKDEPASQDAQTHDQIVNNFPDRLAGALRVPAVFEKPKK